MFDKVKLKSLKPLFIFFSVYSVIFIAAVYTINFTFPFLAGFLLALMVQPLIRLLKEKLHLKSGLASALVTLLVFLVLFGLLFLLGYWLIYEIANLITNMKDFSDTNSTTFIIPPLNDLFNKLKDYLSQIDSNFWDNNKEQILGIAKTGMDLASTLLTSILHFLTSLPAIFTMLIVVVFSTYFFSKDMPSIKNHLSTLLSETTVINIRSASKRSFSMMGKYISSYMFIYFITFIETIIVFTLLDVPYPLVLSILAGIADVIPVLGPGTIYIPLAVLSLFQGKFFTAAALMIAWLLISAIRQIIEPKIVSASINIHPLWVLAALYFSLVAKNFWILIYVTLFLVLYEIFAQVDALPRLFQPPQVKEPSQKDEKEIKKQ